MTKVAKRGAKATSSVHRSAGGAGTLSSSTRIVIAMAKIPSARVSSRFGGSPTDLDTGRCISQPSPRTGRPNLKRRRGRADQEDQSPGQRSEPPNLRKARGLVFEARARVPDDRGNDLTFRGPKVLRDRGLRDSNDGRHPREADPGWRVVVPEAIRHPEEVPLARREARERPDGSGRPRPRRLHPVRRSEVRQEPAYARKRFLGG